MASADDKKSLKVISTPAEKAGNDIDRKIEKALFEREMRTKYNRYSTDPEVSIMMKNVTDKEDLKLLVDILCDDGLMPDEIGKALAKYYTEKKKLIVPELNKILNLYIRLKDI